MPWLPLMILVVFGVVSLGVLYHTPKEHRVHNVKRVIRGAEPLEPVVEPVVSGRAKKWQHSGNPCKQDGCRARSC